MTTSTDGKEVVFLVFNADGYECENFVGAFGSEDEALDVAQRVELLIRRFYVEYLEGREWRGVVTVKSVALGDYELPADVAFALER